MILEKIISSIISGLFQALAVTYVLAKQEKNLNKKEKTIFFLILFVISTISLLLIPNQIRLIYSLTTMSIVLYSALKIKDKRSIIYSLIIMVFLSIAEIIATSLMVLIGVKSTDIVNDPLCNVIANIFISITTIIIVTIPFIKRFIIKIDKFFINGKKRIYYLYLFILVLYTLVSKNGLELLLKSNYTINILFMIGVTVLIIIIMNNEQKQAQLKEINKQTISYIQKYEKIITEQGKANHEFKNQLMVIKGYADMNSPKLKDYLNVIVKDSNKRASTYLISELNKFPDGGVKGLLYYKLSIMEEKKIRYEIYSDEKAKNKAKVLSEEQISLTTKILGVLIDNAIDAATKAKEKNIIISLSKEHGKICFGVSNTYKGKIEQDKIGTGYTTKGKGHGFGLRLVNDIVKANDIFSYSIDVTEKYYNVKLEIITTKKEK